MTKTRALYGLLTVFLVPAGALAQSQHVGRDPAAPIGHEEMMHAHMMHQPTNTSTTPTQPGQSAFAAIQEIVGILESDPETDWSMVNIEALRQHLCDMNNVTLATDVESEPIDGGTRFLVTGVGAVRDSIRRMVTAHAATMNGVDGWHFEVAEIDGGAALTVRPPAKDADKLSGLGFFGVMTRGMHHQEHHLMIARGQNPHHPQ